MKNVSCVLAILFVTCAQGYAQTGISGATGTWRAEAVGPPFSWTVVLRVDGPRLTGVVRGCFPAPILISEGHIDGNTITFKCKTPTGDRTITFIGTINGDEIAFTWELQVRDVGIPPNPRNEVFGTSAPPRFIAKRVPDAADAELAEVADQVRGVEIAAAVNLLQKDVKVEGTLFLPQKVGRLRGLIVVLGWGLGGTFFEDAQVRRLLETTESGLLLAEISYIATALGNGPVVSNANQGGADGLFVILQRLAEESGHEELTEVPLLFWGHSAAAGFGPSFAALHPQRTIALVGYHSGLANGNLDVLSHIPALFLAGGKDTTVPWERMQDLWRRGRSVGAPWTFAIEPDADHGSEEYLKKANALMIPWATAAIRQRLSPDGKTLRVVTDGSAWLGNNRTGEVTPYGTFPGSKAEASWLPDDSTARGWRVVLGAAK